MLMETIKWTIDAGLTELDLLRGDMAYKKHFADSSRPLSHYVFARGVRGLLAMAAYQWKVKRKLRAAAPADVANDSEDRSADGGADAS
jgi:CelD/BcsL family acetyltransferase involved in cellulose biosynthesis